ncbi:MAG: helix-turn-helix domain-containing protein [Desulfamplus sp.]
MNLKDPSVFDKELGAKIRDIRVLRGYSVGLVADAMNCDKSYILKVENGDVRLSVFFMHKLLKFLRVRSYVIIKKRKD